MERKGKYLTPELANFRKKVRAKMLDNNVTLKDIGEQIDKTEYQVWFILNGYRASWKDYVEQIAEAVG